MYPTQISPKTLILRNLFSSQNEKIGYVWITLKNIEIVMKKRTPMIRVERNARQTHVRSCKKDSIQEDRLVEMTSPSEKTGDWKHRNFAIKLLVLNQQFWG